MSVRKKVLKNECLYCNWLELDVDKLYCSWGQSNVKKKLDWAKGKVKICYLFGIYEVTDLPERKKRLLLAYRSLKLFGFWTYIGSWIVVTWRQFKKRWKK